MCAFGGKFCSTTAICQLWLITVGLNADLPVSTTCDVVSASTVLDVLPFVDSCFLGLVLLICKCISIDDKVGASRLTWRIVCTSEWPVPMASPPSTMKATCRKDILTRPPRHDSVGDQYQTCLVDTEGCFCYLQALLVREGVCSGSGVYRSPISEVMWVFDRSSDGGKDEEVVGRRARSEERVIHEKGATASAQ